ncbi:MAG TPA: hypothetical protein VM791_02250 [Vicinamibacterales bacterium]|nr:hypothetical protein [Vicinamibacterales bacterium]
MASGSQGGDAPLTIGETARYWWPVTVTSIAATRSGGSLAAPLLRNEENILHPLQLVHLRIAVVVNGRHGDCQCLYLRASWMLSEIVCSGARQKLRTTKGGTTATQATTIQFETDVIPIASAPRMIAIDQAMNSSVFVLSEEHETSVATGNRARCAELHGVRRRGEQTPIMHGSRHGGGQQGPVDALQCARCRAPRLR